MRETVNPPLASFKSVVAAHANDHSAAYLQSLFRKQGASSAPELMPLGVALANGTPLDQWVDGHVSESALPLRDWLSFGGGLVEAIGILEGRQVYFNPAAGCYAWADASDEENIIELWLTSPHYPPGW